MFGETWSAGEPWQVTPEDLLPHESRGQVGWYCKVLCNGCWRYLTGPCHTPAQARQQAEEVARKGSPGPESSAGPFTYGGHILQGM